MSDQSAHEPTMEEILASIRRIISEDDAAPEDEAPEAVEDTPEPAVEAAPQYEPEPQEEVSFDAAPEDEDVLELTTPIEDSRPSMSIGDIDAYEPMAAAAAVAATASASSLLSERSAASAISAFGQLTSSSALPREGRTIEDLLTELLRPMLKDWLDSNLPAVVESAVREEVERLARQSRR
ncbi:MAG: DUF2497 domain-containing protein [Asticcacaulis sp.]|uniref:DUF2497 domain-containing protein n=1 Tax=Asticcacaulis tiandongensis TaxID=2565365 RepID=UPI00112E9312|nr:DUF2497 domain-containing protein [Asticcacaulis tiandongensis]